MNNLIPLAKLLETHRLEVESKDERIAELESIAYSVQSADLCYGSYSTYEIDSSVVEKAKELLKDQE